MKSITVILLCLLATFATGLKAQEKTEYDLIVVVRANNDGHSDSFTVEPDGKYSYDDSNGKTTKGELTAEQKKGFNEAVMKVEWIKLPKASSAIGAAKTNSALYDYSVGIRIDKKLHEVSFHESAFAKDKNMQTFLQALLKLKK